MVKMAKNHGIKGTPEEFRFALEINFSTAYKTFSLTESQIKEFREYESDYNLEPIAEPFKDTEKVLQAVIDAGKKNFIYTHRAKESTVYYLEKYDLMKYFSDMVTADDNFPYKPNPTALIHLSEKHGFDKTQAIMIGDREIDVASGVNAGMEGCLLTTKTKKSCAKYIFDSIGDVLKLI